MNNLHENRMNLPYGLQKNEMNEWEVFNRKYEMINSLFWKKPIVIEGKTIISKYKNLTEPLLLNLADHDEDNVEKDVHGNIIKIWFYKDSNNPIDDPLNWDRFNSKIELLSKL